MVSSFATKELRFMCFAKDKRYRLRNFLRIFRATIFGTTSLLLYIFLTYPHKRKTTAQQKKNTCSRSTRQEQYKRCEICIKVTVKRMSDTGASSLDVVLVSLLLTFNIGIVCRFVVSWHFCQFCSANISLFKFNKKEIRTLNVESVQS